MIINNDNTVTIEKDTGYWDLSFYPWGGDFKRFTCDVTLPIKRIVDTFKDKSPRKLIALYGNKEVGLQR